MNYIKVCTPEKIPPPRCAKPNSRLSIRTGITANPSIGRPSSCTPAREQLFSALYLKLIGIRLLFSNYGDSMYCVYRIQPLSSRFFPSCDPIHSQRARVKSLVFCPPFLLFRALFTLAEISLLFAALTKSGRGTHTPPALRLPLLLEGLHHSPDRSCGAILFSRIHLLFGVWSLPLTSLPALALNWPLTCEPSPSSLAAHCTAIAAAPSTSTGSSRSA